MNLVGYNPWGCKELDMTERSWQRRGLMTHPRASQETELAFQPRNSDSKSRTLSVTPQLPLFLHSCSHYNQWTSVFSGFQSSSGLGSMKTIYSHHRVPTVHHCLDAKQGSREGVLADSHEMDIVSLLHSWGNWAWNDCAFSEVTDGLGQPWDVTQIHSAPNSGHLQI